MRRTVTHPQPWAVASLVAAIATAAVAGTVAGITFRQASKLAVLDPRASFDPYYGLAEYALSVEPIR